MLPSVIGIRGAGDRGISGAPLVGRIAVAVEQVRLGPGRARDRGAVQETLHQISLIWLRGMRDAPIAAAVPSAENKLVPGTYRALTRNQLISDQWLHAFTYPTRNGHGSRNCLGKSLASTVASSRRT
jgi:hypothetical protein